MHATTVSITGWFLAEIIIIEHLIAAFIGVTLWKNKRGDPSGAVVLCAILGILGVLLLAIATPRQKENRQRRAIPGTRLMSPLRRTHHARSPALPVLPA